MSVMSMNTANTLTLEVKYAICCAFCDCAKCAFYALLKKHKNSVNNCLSMSPWYMMTLHGDVVISYKQYAPKIYV